VLSLADPAKIRVEVRSRYLLKTKLVLVDELPVQFQKRDFQLQVTLKPQ
jgi:hypothetical protein